LQANFQAVQSLAQSKLAKRVLFANPRKNVLKKIIGLQKNLYGIKIMRFICQLRLKVFQLHLLIRFFPVKSQSIKN